MGEPPLADAPTKTFCTITGITSPAGTDSIKTKSPCNVSTYIFPVVPTYIQAPGESCSLELNIL